MLYGNLIFIKKTGGDGSKFPVTEKNIKIGRSENCLIRIYNPQVAPEHCQLIIDCNGQAKLRNLFTPTILNGKPLGQGDVTLCHGDVFKLGERLARWEYLPTSKYFKQLLSPTGRLVAVVNPQRRSVENPGTSSLQVSVSKSTPVGSKRKISEKLGSESTSTAKQRRTFGADGSLKPKIELSKFLMGRHSIKSGKVLLKTPVVTQRKSVAGVLSVKTPKSQATEKSRKSTLPSWKVSAEGELKKNSPPRKNAANTPPKRSLKNEVRTPSKSTPVKVKTPKNLKLYPKTGDKTALKTIMESPSKPEESTRSTRSFSKSPPVKVLSTPKQKYPVQASRLVQSEKKPKSSKKSRKMSLELNRVDKEKRGSTSGKISISGKKSTKGRILSNEDEAQVEVKVSPPVSSVVNARKSSLKNNASVSPTKRTQKTLENSKSVKTPRKSNVLSKQSSVKKVTKDIIETPPLIDFSDEGGSVDTETSPESIKSSRKSVRKFSARLIDFQTPQKNVSEVGISTVRKSTGKQPLSLSATPSASISYGSRKSGTSSSKKIKSSTKENKSPRGVRRNLSPSISSERAAKKLKTSSPKKPDKNKRAALLVLGKANRKQLLPQNVKVLLKQKIVKKAIKQSVTLPQHKIGKSKTQVKKLKKPLQKKQKNSTKKCNSSKVLAGARSSQTVKESSLSSKSETVNESESNKKIAERRSPVKKLSSAVTPSISAKSSPKSSIKPESVPPNQSTNETVLPFIKFDKSSESYVFSSNRRCSKRLSSKNDTERPDFVELSPTALGLIPKKIEVFKTPKEKKRKSSSLVTPKNVRTTGIIKSASTSKIGNRKNVSFSSKDLSVSSTPFTLDVNDKTDFDFDSFHTSDITMDVFVSPLNKSNATPRAQSFRNECVKSSDKIKISPNCKISVREQQETPQKEPPSKLLRLSEQNETPKNAANDSGKARRSLKNQSADVRGARRLLTTPKQEKSPKNELTDIRGVKKLFSTPEEHKSPKNDLSDVRGVKKLMRTPKVQKSPKNDLSDVRGVKKLMRTPKIQKSPKNDLSDLRGVKKLMRTPKVQRSPKNDLSDVRGVKKLMKTPKEQKSPKNDLSDVRGVKKLMRTPKVQKSPKNDLSDVRGVKKLMRTPKVQKSPKNDLTDVRGVKRIMRTPKEQKSPKNELTDLRGVKKLLQTPRNQKSPINDLTDVTGVKKLLKTPKAQKSPKNDLIDFEGVAELFMSPQEEKSSLRKVKKTSKEPKNDLSDVTGVRELFARHKPISDYNISLTGVAELFDMLKDEEEKGVIKTEGEKSPEVKETKTVRRRTRKLNEENQDIGVTPKSRARKGSVEVITRSTRSRKQISVAHVEKETSKRSGVEAAKKRGEVKKTVLKKEMKNSEEEETKKSRKRKAVDAVVPSPPKLRRRVGVTTSKVESTEPKTTAKPRGRKAGEKTSPKSSTKVAEKSKTPTKKASKVQTKATKSSGMTQKVQKGRSQSSSKKETSKSGSKISPKKTRSAKAKSSGQEVQTATGRRKK